MPRLKRGMTPIVFKRHPEIHSRDPCHLSWPGLTRTRRNPVNIVMVRLVRAIHVFTAFKSWMPRLKRGMTDYKSVIPGFIPGIHATVMAGLGVEGDAHAGATVKHRSRVRQDPTAPNLRQVHLVMVEKLEALAGKASRSAPV